MSAAAGNEHSLFAGGPQPGLAARLGLTRGGRPQLARRALFAIGIGWLPLALLTALHGDFTRPDTADSFLLDFGIHTRYLVAVPLLILAEAFCAPRLGAIARQFLDAGLITEADRHHYDSAVISSQRLMNSRVTQIVLVVLACALAYPVVLATPPEEIAAWHGTQRPFALFPAGWWAFVISLPLLLVLLLRWLWRIFLWARFLWLINRLPLQLDPAYPDRAGGLRFVGSSLEGFLPLGFIVGVIAAGPVVKQVVHYHADPLQFRSLAIGAAITVLVLCAGPLLIFVGRLIKERQNARLQYGARAMRMGLQFRLRWLSSGRCPDQPRIDVPEFAGTNAMYLIAANALRLQILPLDLKSTGLLILATLLPFIPVWLMAVPFDQIAKRLGVLLI